MAKKRSTRAGKSPSKIRKVTKRPRDVWGSRPPVLKKHKIPMRGGAHPAAASPHGLQPDVGHAVVTTGLGAHKDDGER